MSRFIIYLLIFLFSNNLLANKDSLWAIWNNSEIQDSVRVEVMYSLIDDFYAYEDLDSALFLLDTLTKVARRNKLIALEAEAFGLKANLYRYQGNLSTSLEVLPKPLDYLNLFKTQ